MQKMNLQQLANTVDGQLTLLNDELVQFEAVSTDTRSIQKGELFIALKGDNFDADNFVEQAQKKGAVAALVSKQSKGSLPTIKVENVQLALAKLASAERAKSGLPLVAITGSNGKTTVKEMLASIVKQSKSVLATKGNFNNHIGVPLTLLRLTPEDEVAIIEMGASKPGDIAELCDIAKPNVSVINNIAAAHIAGFGSLEGVASTKAEIISGLLANGIAVLNADEPWFDDWCDLAKGRQVISFGESKQADVRMEEESLRNSFENGAFNLQFNLLYQGRSTTISMALMGQHNIQNALAASAAAFALGIESEQIKKGLALMKPVDGRLQPLAGINNTTIINDTYNANPKSLEAALSALSELEQPVWLVLGDFAELGEDELLVHQQIGELAAEKGIQKFFAIGEKMNHAVASFQKIAGNKAVASFYQDKKALVTVLKNELGKTTADIIILVKGSRSQAMEEVVEQLVEKGNG